MTRRRATILLHWSVLTLLMLTLAAGLENAILNTAFGLAGLAMVALALIFGLMNGPGPKPEGALRAAHPRPRRGMYLLLACASPAPLMPTPRVALPDPPPRHRVATHRAGPAAAPKLTSPEGPGPRRGRRRLR